MRLLATAEADGTSWAERDHRAREVIELPEHGARFTVDEIYEGIALDPA